jgi:hypothetical protein
MMKGVLFIGIIESNRDCFIFHKGKEEMIAYGGD